MALLELPHTHGCVVCGMSNPHGLKLSLHVNIETGEVSATFTPRDEHIGFEGIVHGGLLATILDEAMVWAATWHNKRFCVSGEMNIRYRKNAQVGRDLTVQARVEAARSRLIETIGKILDDSGAVVAEASGKYIPVAEDRHQGFMHTLVDDAGTRGASVLLRNHRKMES